MPVILLTTLKTIGSLLLSLLTSLLTEKFLKRAIIAGMETLSQKTASDLDDKLTQAMREAWFPSESVPSQGGGANEEGPKDAK